MRLKSKRKEAPPAALYGLEFRDSRGKRWFDSAVTMGNVGAYEPEPRNGWTWFSVGPNDHRFQEILYAAGGKIVEAKWKSR